MPPRKYHLEFDDVLRDRNIICDDTDGSTVHRRLDYHSKSYGIDHRELDELHQPESIRVFIDNIITSLNNIYQGTATDYLRIAYGHVTLDEIASRYKRKLSCEYKELEWGDIYQKTLAKFRREGYYKKYYKFR
jgi:hypothetical protein